MEIIFLGTGTGVPWAQRGSPGLAILSEGCTILLDGGSGTLRQLAAAGLSYNDLDFIIYTHFHPDHTADLAPYLFATRYWPGFTRTGPAVIYGPEGLLDLYGHLRQAYGHWIEPPQDRVMIRELPLEPGYRFKCGSLQVESWPINHTATSLGYRLISSEGLVTAVSGDTDFSPELIELARGVDLLITECSFPEGQKREGHLTPSLAGQAAREAGVKSLALTHFYPETQGHDLLAAVRREFSGPVTLAHDLCRLRLNGPGD
ncbi:MAG: MBL fold metallo-hydrolase [Thermodesulfobacteriota bacterium]